MVCHSPGFFLTKGQISAPQLVARDAKVPTKLRLLIMAIASDNRKKNT